MGLELYPSIMYKGDLTPGDVGEDIDQICEEIHDACKGFGTNEGCVFQKDFSFK